MPILLTETPEMPVPQVPPRKRWTREECAVMDAAGLFQQERLELVDGELINKMPKNRPHSNAFIFFIAWLIKVLGEEFVNGETPIDVSPEDNPTSEPIPDLIVLNRKTQTLVSGNPQPQDLRLVIEIGDSTLKFDLNVKAALYARAQIVEYWVLDIEGRRLFCHRDPVHGRYTSVVIYQEHELLAPMCAPDALFSAALVLR